VAHETAFGRNFISSNPQFTGAIDGHSFSGGAFQPGVVPVTTTADIFGIQNPLTGCPPGQINVPFLGCIDVPNPFADPTDPTGACNPGFALDASGNCVAVDPTGPPISPTERGAVADGPALPSRVARNVHVCPKFVDGSTGILYFSPISGQIVCLPRSMTSKSAMAFGLLRKNRPRAKAAVSAADMKLLSKVTSIQNKIGTLAAKADGLSCPPRQKKK